MKFCIGRAINQFLIFFENVMLKCHECAPLIYTNPTNLAFNKTYLSSSYGSVLVPR